MQKTLGSHCGAVHPVDWQHFKKITDYEKLESDLLTECQKAKEGGKNQSWVNVFTTFKNGFDIAHKHEAGDYYICLFNNHFYKNEFGYELPNVHSVEAMFMGIEKLKNLLTMEGGGNQREFFIYNALMSFKFTGKPVWRNMPIFTIGNNGKYSEMNTISVCNAGDKRGDINFLNMDRSNSVAYYVKMNSEELEEMAEKPHDGGRLLYSSKSRKKKRKRTKKKRKRTKKKRRRKKKKTRKRRRKRSR